MIRSRDLSWRETHLDYYSRDLESNPDILEDESNVVTAELYSAADLYGEGNTDQESWQEKRPAS